MDTSTSKQPGPIWLKSPYPARELDGKTVQFRIFADHGTHLCKVTGRGKFRALGNNDGLTRIEIVVTQMRSPSELVDTIFYCHPASAAAIQKALVLSLISRFLNLLRTSL